MLTGMQGDYKLFWKVIDRARVHEQVCKPEHQSTGDVLLDLKSFINKEVAVCGF